MPIEVCRNVRLLCREIPNVIPLYREVRVGTYVTPYCRVGFCTPKQCVIAPPTEITVESYVEYRVRELENNMLVELRFERGREIYIYPKKVWREIEHRFLEPMSKGMQPREQGALLYGPPGVGKTSMTEIIADILGLYVVPIDPQNVLSKWLGEAEQNLAKLLAKAESSEPSVVLMDDAEWLVRSRHLVTGEDSAAYLGMMNVLLRKIQEWKRSGKLTIALVTTNVSEDKIDPALRRSGRLGRPIFVPLPDFEAVHTLLLELGVPNPDAERLAIEIVNAGLPMSDAVSIAKDYLAGAKPSIEPIKARGYTRLVPPTDISRKTMDYLKGRYRDLCEALREGTRIWVPLPYTVSLPMMATIIGVVCRKPVVVVTDPRNIDEAIATADTCDATLLVVTELIPHDYIKLVALVARCPIVFCGSERPNVLAMPFPLDVGTRDTNIRPYVLEIVAKFYGVAVNGEDLSVCKHLKDSEWSKLIESIGVFRAPISVLRKFTFFGIDARIAR